MKSIIVTLASVFLVSCAGTTAISGNVKPYPSQDCIVTDNKLGSMGPVVTKVHGDQEVKFCCKPCVAKFDKDPQRYLSKL
jgi:hypothetical protein